MEPKKQCSKCKQWKLRSEFYKEAGRADGMNCACKDCKRAYRDAKKPDQYAAWCKKNEKHLKRFLSEWLERTTEA